MAHHPANRRMNLIRQMCVRLVREVYPSAYEYIVKFSEQEIPKGKQKAPQYWNIGLTRRKKLDMPRVQNGTSSSSL